jgi:non-ribosomal peptide synthetase component E (peptide arylation enzyme)
LFKLLLLPRLPTGCSESVVEARRSIAFHREQPLIRAHAAERPDHSALIKSRETVTYGGLAELTDGVAVALHRDGVGTGEAVAICAAPRSTMRAPPSAHDQAYGTRR